MDELLARLRAAVRRAARGEEPTVTTDDFTIDLAQKRVIDRAGRPCGSRRPSGTLLDVLVRNAGKLVSQRQLLHEVWGPAYGDETTTCGSTWPICGPNSSPTVRSRATSSPSRAWVIGSSADRSRPI